MGKVTSDMSMSLDGFIAGPNDDLERPLGDGGDRLHQWVYGLASWRELHSLAGGKTNRDAEVLDESFKTTWAVVMGRRMFNLGERYWGDNRPFHNPVFVVTHEAREAVFKHNVYLRHRRNRKRAEAGTSRSGGQGCLGRRRRECSSAVRGSWAS